MRKAFVKAGKTQTSALAFIVILFFLTTPIQTLTRENGDSQPQGFEAMDAFDSAVQRRFHDVIGFGMVRISTQRWFLPETKEEKDSVKGLNQAGYEVCLYLVGRNILQDIPERHRKSNIMLGNSSEHLMSGPVFVGKRTMKGLPDARAMWEPSRAALRKFDSGAARDSFGVAGWNIEARPVKASEDSCLSCHGYDVRLTFDPQGPSYSMSRDKERNHLRVGDTLGVALYVHRKKS